MPFFLGREAPPGPRTTTAQKCFRTPDIDEVGLDTYHLTFFEMLGNFSFGDYFKEGAVAFATEFIQERLKLDWDRIWVSVHAGDPELKLGPDEVAIDLWKKIGMPPERIVPLPSSENFWSVGGPGPCGPDSEIYYDFGPEAGCGEPDCQPGCTRCERFLEFWNLVFMEYEQHADGTLTPLPKQNIDTGLGLERTARIVQGVPSVYDTDAYQTIMAWIAARVRRRVRRLRRRDEGASRARGSRPRDDVPRRRGRRAVERGPRLRAAPRDPARRAARLADRDAGAVPRRARRRRDRRDGRRVSGARRAPRRDPSRARRRGGAVRRDARARDEALRRGGRPRRDHRRRRVHAPGDVRLPDRADAGDGARARPRRQRRGVHAADGGAPRDLARGRRRRERGARGGLRDRRPASAASSSATRRPTC